MFNFFKLFIILAVLSTSLTHAVANKSNTVSTISDKYCSSPLV